MDFTQTLDKLSLEEKYKMFTVNGFYNITDGFPFASAQELFETLYLNMFLGQEISRLPIIATQNGVFIQTQPNDGQMQHSSLLQIMGISEDQIKYASGIEQLKFTEPTSGPYIRVPFIFNGVEKVGYWVIKTSSDTFDKPLTSDEGYIKELKNIFEKIEGVKFYT